MIKAEKNYIDMHTHSENSFDASGSVVQMCEAAVTAGLRGFAVTDHCEVEPYKEERFGVSARQSFFDIIRAKEIFKGQVELIAGVELGYSRIDRVTAEHIVTAYPYDVVLGSMHNLPGRLDFYFLDYTDLDCGSLFANYLDEVAEMVDWGKFDVLTHITYPLRYINGRTAGGEPCENIDPMDYKAGFERIFRKIIEKRIALELNLSGLRKGGSAMPGLELLKLYRSLGGELLTIGSDAHCAADIGAKFKAGIEIAKRAGFGGYCCYHGREPVFIDF